MVERTQNALAALYETDETAWLEAMAQLVAERKLDELDCEHLSEYLADMAISERREVLSRLVTLLSHLLKWEHQPHKRSRSWAGTIRTQRRELGVLLESRTLYNHAVEILPRAYREAREQAATETGLPLSAFPADLARSIEELLKQEPTE